MVEYFSRINNDVIEIYLFKWKDILGDILGDKIKAQNSMPMRSLLL